jgi:hypothetical protein
MELEVTLGHTMNWKANLDYTARPCVKKKKKQKKQAIFDHQIIKYFNVCIRIYKSNLK